MTSTVDGGAAGEDDEMDPSAPLRHGGSDRRSEIPPTGNGISALMSCVWSGQPCPQHGRHVAISYRHEDTSTCTDQQRTSSLPFLYRHGNNDMLLCHIEFGIAIAVYGI